MKDTMAQNPKLIQKHGFLFFLRQTSGFNGNAALDSYLLVEITQLKVFAARFPQSTEGIPAARGGAEHAGFLLLSGRSPREKQRAYLSVASHPCSPHGLFPSCCLLVAPGAYLQAYSARQSLWPASRRMLLPILSLRQLRIAPSNIFTPTSRGQRASSSWLNSYFVVFAKKQEVPLDFSIPSLSICCCSPSMPSDRDAELTQQAKFVRKARISS